MKVSSLEKRAFEPLDLVLHSISPHGAPLPPRLKAHKAPQSGLARCALATDTDHNVSLSEQFPIRQRKISSRQ